MEVAARRVHAQRPAGTFEDLPRRESQRMAQKVAERRRRQRRGTNQAAAKELVVSGARKIAGRCRRIGSGVQRENGGAVERAERPRLRCPVEITERGSKSIEVVF